jgi:hypothetical protein
MRRGKSEHRNLLAGCCAPVHDTVIVVIIYFMKGIGGKMKSNSKLQLKIKKHVGRTSILGYLDTLKRQFERSVDYTKFVDERRAYPDMSEMGFDQSPSTSKLRTSMSFLSVDTGPKGVRTGIKNRPKKSHFALLQL